MELVYLFIIGLFSSTIILLILEIKKTNRERKKLELKLITSYKEKDEVKKELCNLQFELSRHSKVLKQVNALYIDLLLTKPTIFSHSKFYSNFSYHNKKYYVKINENKVNNRAVGIPIIKVINESKKQINIDLLALKHLIRGVKDSNSNTLSTSLGIIEAVQLSLIHKDSLISKLGNKDLKYYEGKSKLEL